MKKIKLLLIIIGIILIVIILFSISHIKEKRSVEKKILFTSDWHYGNNEGNGTSILINQAIDWIKSRKDIDFMFNLGDTTDVAEESSFDNYIQDEEEIIKNTNIKNIFTINGNHEFIQNRNKNLNGIKNYYRKMNYTSGWYYIKIGNNIFIFTNSLTKNDKPFFPKSHLKWLEETIKENYKKNNIFVLQHHPLYGTNKFSKDYWGMDYPIWQNNSKEIIEILEKYKVDVFFNGHVHYDINCTYKNNSGEENSILIRNLIRNTSYISVPVIAYNHGPKDGCNTFPSVMIANFKEGEDFFTIEAVNINSNKNEFITNDVNQKLKKIKIPLSHKMNFFDNNSIDDFGQAWDVSEYSNESTNNGISDWWDEDGLKSGKNSWVVLIWDFYKTKKITNIKFNYSEDKGVIENEYYCKYNDQKWISVDKNNLNVSCRFLKIKSYFYPKENQTMHVYDIKID